MPSVRCSSSPDPRWGVLFLNRDLSSQNCLAPIKVVGLSHPLCFSLATYIPYLHPRATSPPLPSNHLELSTALPEDFAKAYPPTQSVFHMADRHNRPSRRGGDRSHHDDSSRRDRYATGGRDRDRDYRKDRDEDTDRTNDASRNRDRDYRRHRSRSRDRKDRRRSRSPQRDRGYDRRDERARGGGEDKTSRRRDDERNSHRNRPENDGRDKESTRRRSASPKPPPGPEKRRESLELDGTLPTRSKPAVPAPVQPAAQPAHPVAPVSFRVKGHDQREGSHGAEQHPRATSHDSHEGHQHREEEDRPAGRFGAEPMDEDEEEDVVVEDAGLDAMQAMMGFGGFGTTKNQKVLGNNVGAVRKEKKTEYRQYMNRVGGFNRPLSPGR